MDTPKVKTVHLKKAVKQENILAKNQRSKRRDQLSTLETKPHAIFLERTQECDEKFMEAQSAQQKLVVKGVSWVHQLSHAHGPLF